MIDLSKFCLNIQDDPIKKTVTVSPGTTLGYINYETAAFGLVLLVGINSMTGIAGLYMGGGMEWLSCKYEMTLDSLLRATIVLHDGPTRIGSNNENEELFWVIHGGGGNFGIAIFFEF